MSYIFIYLKPTGEKLIYPFVAEQYKDAYPSAKVVGSEDLLTKPESEGIKLDTGSCLHTHSSLEDMLTGGS